MLKRLSDQIRLVLCLVLALHWPFSVSLMGRQVANPNPTQPQIVFTEQDVLDDQEEIFEALFGVEYDPDHWTYPLDEQVIDTGEYTGSNHLNQPFVLTVIAADPVDVTSLQDLTPAEMQFAIDNGFQYVGVIGTLSSDLATIPVQGLAVYQSNATIPFDSRFVVSKKENPNNPLFSNQYQSQEGGDGDPPFTLVILIPVFCPDPQCAGDCEDAYEDCVNNAHSNYDAGVAAAEAAMDAAQAAYDSAKAAAQGAYDTLKDAAQATLATALTVATGKLVVDQIKCTAIAGLTWWMGGGGSLPCILKSLAFYAVKVAGAIIAYQGAIEIAQGIYNSMMEGPQADYDAAVQAYDQELDDLQQELEDALQDCEDAYEECMDDCPYVVCGWIIIIITQH